MLPSVGGFAISSDGYFFVVLYHIAFNIVFGFTSEERGVNARSSVVGLIPLKFNLNESRHMSLIKNSIQGSVVQSIISFTSLLRGQFVKCFTILYPNKLIFFVDTMREAFAMQKLLTFFSTKNIGVFEIFVFEILTKR